MSADFQQLDKDFIWETEYVPNVGDNVSISLEHLSYLPWANDVGWIDGKVLKREF